MNFKSSNMPEKWPVKAYKNLDFLNSREARLIRIHCEMEEPRKRLEQMGVKNTMVFFGSARVPDSKTAQANLEIAQKAVAKDKNDKAAAEALKTAKRLLKCAPYHDEGRELARLMTEWSLSIEDPGKRLLVCTGAGPGMMQAANQGAQMAGGDSIGLGISLPFEPKQNPYVTEELAFEFHYFFVRKYWFLYLCKAMVVLPGGFGTMDELFEILTLRQTLKTQKHIPTVLLGKKFWNDIINFQAYVDWGVISEKDLGLFQILDSAEEAKEYLVSELNNHHF